MPGPASPPSLLRLRLYINIDHIATVRQARRGHEPDPVEAALQAERAGVDGITAHLREDRRHIQDDDVHRLASSLRVPLNFEMACADEILAIAERIRPHQAMFVPERREEVTTEGGLDTSRDAARIRDGIARMRSAGIRTCLFIDPDPAAVERSRELGTDAVELHTGPYAHAPHDPRRLAALRAAAKLGRDIGLAVHAGHGLTVTNVAAVASIPQIEEVSIGHSVISRAIFVGLDEAIRELRRAIDDARAHF